MSKYSAYGATLTMGIQQVETAIIVGTISSAGNSTFTLTKSGMTGSPIATTVALALGDTPTVTATKAAAQMNLNANITAKCKVEANGDRIIVTALAAAANDATMNLAYANAGCAGLVNDATSDDTTAGVAPVTIAQVQSFDGPELAANTEDVTTHDSTAALEEVVVTTLTTGELSFDIVYDPNGSTHEADAPGLINKLQNKTYAQFAFTFPSNPTATWTLNGYVDKFQPSAPVDGALTASVAIKVTGAPSLV